MDDVYEPFHIRQRNTERAGQPVLYRYDVLPQPFRVQVYRIIKDTVGEQPSTTTVHYVNIGDEPLEPRTVGRIVWIAVSEELGLTTSISGGWREYHDLLLSGQTPIDQLLTAIEIAFRAISKLRDSYRDQFRCRYRQQDAIAQLNRRFRQHDLGYAFEGGIVVRVDSQYLHTQTVSPALQLLGAAGFEGAQALFIEAHEHFRHGENDDAILDAARAFETTMKHICDEMKWEYPDRANAKDLIATVTKKGLFPNWHQNHMNSLRTLLEGLPTVRNKEAGHADTQGEDAPDDMAAFAIHLAASNIVFMVEAFERLRHR